MQYLIRRLKQFIIANRRGVSVLLHTVIIATAYILAYILRFDGRISAQNLTLIGQTLPLLVLIKLAVFHFYHLHQGLFRYAGIQDLVHIIKACSVSSLLFIAAAGIGFRLAGIPRSIFVLDWMLTIALFGGKRMSFRMLREAKALRRCTASGKALNTLIIGAGDAGEMALRELQSNLATPHRVLGFLDDDPAKAGMTIRGVPVRGKLSHLKTVVERYRIQEVLIAMPSAGHRTIQSVVDQCAGLAVHLQILPGFADLITGRISVQAIRDVSIEDLLCRAPVRLDMAQVQSDLHAKTVLISGAGGSIGSELARQVARQKPAALLLLDVAETPLFHIEQELIAKHPDIDIRSTITDIRHAPALSQVFERFSPQRVYHAAAYKHVPLMEANPCQAVLNNIMGTRLLAETARRYGTARFVMISTDKAVHPSNIMGASKRVCELLVTALNGGTTSFAAVRFGNVLGSNGSVIPIFREQIRAGGPITVTHAEMTRYFMTIPEAVMLVLQCGAMALENDIFVLDMGAPVRIMELAENMIRLSGLRVHEDIEIRVTGLRPGEKLHEELVTYGEAVAATPVPKINVLRKQCAGLPASDLKAAIAELEALAAGGQDEAVRRRLNELIAQDRKCTETTG